MCVCAPPGCVTLPFNYSIFASSSSSSTAWPDLRRRAPERLMKIGTFGNLILLLCYFPPQLFSSLFCTIVNSTCTNLMNKCRRKRDEFKQFTICCSIICKINNLILSRQPKELKLIKYDMFYCGALCHLTFSSISGLNADNSWLTAIQHKMVDLELHCPNAKKYFFITILSPRSL
jgi:hypothetical protein